MRRVFFYPILGVLLLVGTAACSSREIPETRIVRNAPQSQSQAGVIVTGVTKSELFDALNTQPQVLVRPIYPLRGIYELQFISIAGARALFPDSKRVKIYDNVYVHLNAASRAVETQRMTQATLDAGDDFIRSCTRFERDASAPAIYIEQPLDRFEISHLVHPGDRVTASLANSPKDLKDPKKKTDAILWRVQAPPESALAPMISHSDRVSFQPDVGGEYAVLLISKAVDNVCRIRRESVYATANPAWHPEAQFSPDHIAHLDLSPFWQVESLLLPDVWRDTRGKDVVIAIIDTGVNYNHPVLAGNMWVNNDEIPGNGIDDDANGFVDDRMGFDFASTDAFPFDDQGHGTHVAGLAASAAFGVAPGARIMALKTLTGLGLDLGSFIGAIYYAVDNGAQVINASFGFTQDHPAFREAVRYANAKNVLLVAAAGNGDAIGMGLDNDRKASYPCNYAFDNIISVTATDENGVLTSYGNYGAHSVDVATFGGTDALQLTSAARQNANGRLWATLYGTSQATPLVAGLAAAILGKNPTLKPAQVRDILVRTSAPNSSLKGKIVSGGTVTPVAAITAATSISTRLMSSP